MKGFVKKLLLLFVVVFISGSVFAADVTLNLQGTIAASYSLTVDGSGDGSETFTIVDNGTEQTVNIADLIQRANNNAGFKVTVTSANNSVLIGSTTADTLNYTLEYISAELGTKTPVLTTGTADIVFNSSTTGNDSVEVNIKYTAAVGTLEADTYEDTLTFTIAAP